jgi:serine/threonine protein kinase
LPRLVNGNDIKQEAHAKKRVFQEEQCAEIAKGLLQAVSYCHLKGIIHRNITPSNVLVEINTDHPKRPIKGVKITDFKDAV